MKRKECLNCCRLVDDATCVSRVEAQPKPGDITICLYCGHLMAFAKDLSMRELTGSEMRMVAGDKRILAVQAARVKVLEEKDDG
jgi:RNase P subunit RPR2